MFFYRKNWEREGKGAWAFSLRSFPLELAFLDAGQSHLQRRAAPTEGRHPGVHLCLCTWPIPVLGEDISLWTSCVSVAFWLLEFSSLSLRGPLNHTVLSACLTIKIGSLYVRSVTFLTFCTLHVLWAYECLTSQTAMKQWANWWILLWLLYVF
jgi:hypothetical protein